MLKRQNHEIKSWKIQSCRECEMKPAFRCLSFLLGGLLLLGGATFVVAQDTGQTAPDNTRMNQRDRDANQATADQQQNNRSDLDITRQVRRAIEADKSFSTY